MKKRKPLHKRCWCIWMSACNRMQINLSITQHKTQVQRIKDFNINPVTLNLIEEKLGTCLEHSGTRDIFLNITPVAQTLRLTIIRWDLLKLKSFCKAKHTVNRTKQQSTEFKRLLTNQSNRGAYKELQKMDMKIPNNPINNGVQI